MKPLILFLSLIILLCSCGSLKEPEFRSVDNIRVTRLGARQSLLALDLHYYNPNKSRLTVKEAEGDAWLDGQLLGHFRIDTLVHIMPLTGFTLPVTLQLDMRHLVRNTVQTLLQPEVAIKIAGKAKVGKGGLFIRYPLKYEGKQSIGALLLGNGN